MKNKTKVDDILISRDQVDEFVHQYEQCNYECREEYNFQGKEYEIF